MSTSTAKPQGTLIIVRYNYGKWKAMEKGTELRIYSKQAGSTQIKEFGTDETEQAEKVAEVLFPEQKEPPLVLAHIDPAKKQNLPLHLQHVMFLDTFESEIFGQLPPDFSSLPRATKEQILDEIFLRQPPQVPPPVLVGWMAVVDDTAYARLSEKMYDNGGVLMKMYDVIEKHTLPAGWTDEDIDSHLNGKPRFKDRTTRDIYIHMSPVNWDVG